MLAFTGLRELLSFDQDFDRTDLPRNTLSDILSRYGDNPSENHTGAAV
jgi:hypothetical protein